MKFFNHHGYLRLEGFHPRHRMAAIRQKLLDELQRLRIWVAGKKLPGPVHNLPPFQQIAKLSTLVKLPHVHEAWMTPELLTGIGRLCGRPASLLQGSQWLLSLPGQGDWTLDGLNWHVDVAARPPDALPGIQAFVLIDDVAPRGGATLALAGSHRLSGARASLREVLNASTHLETDLRALGVTVLEMCGRAGDVFLMDMRLLHTPSVNSTSRLRMMATSRVLLRS
ncbi:phytanoyl-CoA dioxygenase family protein [Schlegelella sp. S2-27]|uniref:Phytanoyl-CoA dioxygenase family protein n=1 Tax=Caldimonas mangrovi TaxID=2944811 RepID=A0ABT0YN83_9BURK|nr:phytanoyl-CoA dioxygenase family protein [Caldimonas mangrovi]MCM5680182.1 phytanoyl-CoA dioxygenase family protein [Caldimonas mangrovi]